MELNYTEDHLCSIFISTHHTPSANSKFKVCGFNMTPEQKVISQMSGTAWKSTIILLWGIF